MKRHSWIVPLLLAGCVPLTTRTVGREFELSIYPKIAPKTQAILNPNTLASIATLDIIPYVYDSGAYKPISSVTGNPTTPGAADMLKLTEASPSIDPNRPFVVRRLKPNTNYRVRAQAYSQANALISEDSSSYVDITVDNNDAPAMASLPVNLINTPFAANTSVLVNTDGRYEYLKGTLYLVTGGSQVALVQTTRSNPEFNFSNLQGATDYKLLVEAYKLGKMMASTSLNFNPGNDTLPATQSVSLTIPYVTLSFVGSNTAGFQDGTGTAALFNTATGLELDPLGNIYFNDYNNGAIRKVTPAGVMTTLAGNGVYGYADGTGTAAQFRNPHSLAVDTSGNVYVGDRGNYRVRKITPQGVVTTIAGNGTAGYAEGTGTLAQFRGPCDVAVDDQGNLFVTDDSNHAIRKITPGGVVTTFAGNGTAGHADGPLASATFNAPRGLIFDPQGNLYVSENGNHDVRKITAGGVVSTLAGNGTAGGTDGTGSNAQFCVPEMLTLDAQGNLFVCERNGNRVRRVTPNGVVTTISGNGTAGYSDGTGTKAILYQAWGIDIDGQGVLYLGEYGNNPIRKIY